MHNKKFDHNNLSLDKQSVFNNNPYYIGYITKNSEYNINSVNPLYLMINRIKGHFEEKDEVKYLLLVLKMVIQYKNIKKFLID